MKKKSSKSQGRSKSRDRSKNQRGRSKSRARTIIRARSSSRARSKSAVSRRKSTAKEAIRNDKSNKSNAPEKGDRHMRQQSCSREKTETPSDKDSETTPGSIWSSFGTCFGGYRITDENQTVLLSKEYVAKNYPIDMVGRSRNEA